MGVFLKSPLSSSSSLTHPNDVFLISTTGLNLGVSQLTLLLSLTWSLGFAAYELKTFSLWLYWKAFLIECCEETLARELSMTRSENWTLRIRGCREPRLKLGFMTSASEAWFFSVIWKRSLEFSCFMCSSAASEKGAVTSWLDLIWSTDEMRLMWWLEACRSGLTCSSVVTDTLVTDCGDWCFISVNDASTPICACDKACAFKGRRTFLTGAVNGLSWSGESCRYLGWNSN